MLGHGDMPGFDSSFLVLPEASAEIKGSRRCVIPVCASYFLVLSALGGAGGCARKWRLALGRTVRGGARHFLTVLTGIGSRGRRSLAVLGCGRPSVLAA